MYYSKTLSIGLILFFYYLPGLAISGQQTRDASQTPTIPDSWQEVSSVEAALQRYPERIHYLFAAIDLSLPELEAVKNRINKKDTVAAAQALLEHFAQSKSGDWLRSSPGKDEHAQHLLSARQLLNDSVTFSGVTARVPRNANGSWQWDFQGPEADAEFGYSLNGHKYMIALLHAWKQSGNEAFARKYDLLVRDWIVHNPLPLPPDSIYIVLNPDNPLDWRDIGEVIWRDLEAGNRLGVSWPHAFYGFQSAEAFSPATRLLMLASMAEQARYLRNYHKQGHNWTTMEMNGLALVGLTFPEFKESEDWARYAMDVMETEINRQVYPDGLQTELSTKTQWVALQRFESIAQNFRKAGRSVKPGYMRRIEEMYNYLAYAMRPDGHQPLNNDADREDLRPRVLKAAEVYQRPDWQWIATNGTAGTQPEGSATTVFPWGGIHVMRSDWSKDAHWAFFDTGVFGTGHQHSDMLHISIAAYGKDLLVDGGRYTHKDYFSFDPSIWRGYFRSTLSHNTILVDGKGQKAGPLRANAPLPEDSYMNTEAFDYARGTFNSGYVGVSDEVKHSRAVMYLRDRFWVVLDHVETTEPHEFQVLWHFHPELNVQIEQQAVATKNPDEANLRIAPLGDIDWKIDIIEGKEQPYKQGWYSETYGKKESNPTAIYELQTSQPTTFAWLLLPAKGEVKAAKAEILSLNKEGARLQVETQNEKVNIYIPLREGRPELNWLEK
jgi:hypothetical protein